MEHAVKPLSRKDIRSYARFIRKLENSDQEYYFDIMNFMECTLPAVYPDFTLSVGTVEELGECHGLTYLNQKEIKLREDVYNGAISGNGRDRLTVAHELFHLLVHSNEPIAFARTTASKIPAYMNSEWQADAFGGELLVPYHLASGLTVEEIIEKCGVSRTAAICQYKKMHGM